MNFDFSEEQALLRATVERFGQERHGHDVEKRRASRAKPGGFDRDGWRALAGLGVLGLPFAEPLGGLGGGPADLIAVALPLGQWLATEPFTESLLAAGTLVEAGGDGAMLAQLMSGEAVAPRIASVSAWSRTSASEWPTAPTTDGTTTPPSTRRRPRLRQWASNPIPVLNAGFSFKTSHCNFTRRRVKRSPRCVD